jgi:hypothetical protein
MKITKKEQQSTSDKTGVSVILSEKALMVIFNVILALGITHLHVQNSVKPDVPVQVFQNWHD